MSDTLDTIPEGRRRKTEDIKPVWAAMPGYQELYLSCTLFELLGEGTRGGGKTDTLLMDFAQHCGPDRRTKLERAAGKPQTSGYGAAWKGIIFRQTYTQLTDLISKSKKWFPLIWPEAVFNASEHYWRWPTGEELLLRQFKHEDDYWKYHGHEYPYIGWEELCNWPDPSGYLRMMSTCRSSMPGMPRKYRSTTNPYGPGHNWVKHRFRLPGMRNTIIKDARDADGRREPPRLALYSSLADNKVLLESDPDYIIRLLSSARNETEKKAWIYGSWDIVAGGMFDDIYDRNVHIIPSLSANAIPSTYRITRSFDWGSSKPFSVGWWAESDGSDLYLPDDSIMKTVRGDKIRFREWYGWNGKPNEGQKITAREITKGIIEMERRWGIHDRVLGGIADAAIFNAENGNCIAQDMEDPVRLDDGSMVPGIFWWPADKSPGSRKTGWEQCRQYLKNAKPNEDGTPREFPGIFVTEDCVQFQRTFPVLPRSNRDLDDVDSDAEDHIGDEVRYFIRDQFASVGSGRLRGTG